MTVRVRVTRMDAGGRSGRRKTIDKTPAAPGPAERACVLMCLMSDVVMWSGASRARVHGVSAQIRLYVLTYLH